MNNEKNGPAEIILKTLLSPPDHLFHGRPGIVVKDANSVIGIRWFPVTHKVEDGKKIVYRLDKVGVRTNRVMIGEMLENGDITNNNVVVATYRAPGFYPEVATYLYTQISELWKIDNEFSARWASYAYNQDNRDLKVALTAFMLVQSRFGKLIHDEDDNFFDDDYRDVGEAMVLTLRRKDKKDLSPKMILRVHDLLNLPEIAEINRKLGFGQSLRRPFTGRWDKAVEKWLGYREDNLPLLNGLVSGGMRRTVMELARRVGYKPKGPEFFKTLRWKQVQAKDGRRELAIGEKVSEAETFKGMEESEVCEYIMKNKTNLKRIVGMVPDMGITRAIMAAAIEAGSLSDKDLVIYTPTLEDLGLLDVQDIRNRWDKAVSNAEDLRAANIAQRVKSKEAREKLEEGASDAVKKAVAEEMKDIRIYFMVDCSGSMEGAIEQAKVYLEKFLQAFPPEKIHISVFNHYGKELKLKRSTKAGVQQAFLGIGASGGTDYGAGIRAIQHHKPEDNEDVLFIFVGDEAAHPFRPAVLASGLNPMAFGFLKVVAPGWGANYSAVQTTAQELGIPCFMIDKDAFDDTYAIPNTIRTLIASTPVNRTIGGVVKRKSLIETILETEILAKPVWAAA